MNFVWAKNDFNFTFWNYIERFVKKRLPEIVSLDPELNDEANPSGLWTSRIGLFGVGGVFESSGLSICIWNVILMAFTWEL